MSVGAIKRVAVIGAGPAGAISIDALVQEQAFDTIRVFERREAPGGCWLGDNSAASSSPPPPPPLLSDFESLANRTADAPLETIPAVLHDDYDGSGSTAGDHKKPPPVRVVRPAQQQQQQRWTESHIYPYLETNVADVAMQFSREPIAAERSARSIALHGADTPFRHWDVLRRYVDGLVRRHEHEHKGNDDDDLRGSCCCRVSYNTTVERVEKVGAEWKVTLHKEEKDDEYDTWWVEWFDAVVVASGHYSVPYVPAIDGLEAMQRARPGSVLHSKHYRGREAYRDKNVVVVGASVSAADIAFDLAEVAASTHAVVIGHTVNRYFGDAAFNHPRIRKCPSIKRVIVAEVAVTNNTAAAPLKVQVELVDGTVISDVDYIIFGTGFSWTLPFFSSSSLSTSKSSAPLPVVRNNRVPDLWQHVVWRHDPTLLFVGAVGAGLTFKIFEWQAVLAARILAGRSAPSDFPSGEEMQRWEEERIGSHGDGPGFTVVHPEFEAYFETLRQVAGPPGAPGRGRELPPFDPAWFAAFMDGHELRKRMWERVNAEAAAKEKGKES